MDHEVHQASGGRSPDASPNPEMAKGGSIGRRSVVGDETGYAAGGSGFTADRQRVSALPLRDAMGTLYPSPEPVDSSTPSSAPLSRRTLLRHSSFVRAVCVDAPVRIWAGGDQRWSSLPRQQCRACCGKFEIPRIRGEEILHNVAASPVF